VKGSTHTVNKKKITKEGEKEHMHLSELGLASTVQG